MKQSFFVLALTFVFSTVAFLKDAKADIIKCSFTEPFLSTEYSMAQQSLTIIDPISEHPKTAKTVIKNVSFQIKGAGVFELVGADKKTIQQLVLNNDGSDGMSDIVFPYEVKWFTMGGLVGGCESNYLKSVGRND